MVALSGENKCHKCGEIIKWQEIKAQPMNAGVFHVSTMEGSQAEVIAIGSEQTRNGRKIKYEIIARCKNCQTNNKFIFET